MTITFPQYTRNGSTFDISLTTDDAGDDIANAHTLRWYVTDLGPYEMEFDEQDLTFHSSEFPVEIADYGTSDFYGTLLGHSWRLVVLKGGAPEYSGLVMNNTIDLDVNNCIVKFSSVDNFQAIKDVKFSTYTSNYTTGGTGGRNPRGIFTNIIEYGGIPTDHGDAQVRVTDFIQKIFTFIHPAITVDFNIEWTFFNKKKEVELTFNDLRMYVNDWLFRQCTGFMNDYGAVLKILCTGFGCYTGMTDDRHAYFRQYYDTQNDTLTTINNSDVITMGVKALVKGGYNYIVEKFLNVNPKDTAPYYFGVVPPSGGHGVPNPIYKTKKNEKAILNPFWGNGPQSVETVNVSQRLERFLWYENDSIYYYKDTNGYLTTPGTYLWAVEQYDRPEFEYELWGIGWSFFDRYQHPDELSSAMRPKKMTRDYMKYTTKLTMMWIAGVNGADSVVFDPDETTWAALTYDVGDKIQGTVTAGLTPTQVTFDGEFSGTPIVYALRARNTSPVQDDSSAPVFDNVGVHITDETATGFYITADLEGTTVVWEAVCLE